MKNTPVRSLLAALIISVIVTVPVTGGAAPAQIHLPTRADLHDLSNALSLLPGNFPNRIPSRGGTIREVEVVHVGLGPHGSAASIVVDQTIEIGGVGDYTIEIAGPATNVEELPGSDAAPGLRRGSLIWEGFCSGKRTLRARVTMDLNAFRFTAPALEFKRVGSTVRITNATARTLQLATGNADAAALDAAIRATRAALGRHRMPVPGAGGIPASIPARGSTGTQPSSVTVPMHVHGTIGSQTIDDVVLNSPLVKTASADAPINLVAEPVLPTAASLSSSLEALQQVLWQSARVDGEGYLGIPLDGPARVKYIFEPYVAPRVNNPKPTTHEQPKPIPIAIASMLLLGACAGAWRWWAAN